MSNKLVSKNVDILKTLHPGDSITITCKREAAKELAGRFPEHKVIVLDESMTISIQTVEN